MNPESPRINEPQAAPPLPGTEPVAPKPRKTVAPTPSEQARHLESKAKYPELSLSTGEYVVEVVRRHPIGLISIWAVAGFLIVLTLFLVPFYSLNMAFLSKTLMVPMQKMISPETLVLPALILAGFFALGGAIATVVYHGNRFYLTNESIIQFIQYSLFRTQQQTVNLINVEDVSSQQSGILEQLLNYGTLRVSTQGEETIYHFKFVAKPKIVASNINNEMEIAVQKLEGHYPVTEF